MGAVCCSSVGPNFQNHPRRALYFLRTYIGFGLVSLIGLAWLIHPLSPPREEPVYAGKTAEQWLNAGYEDASQALQQIGLPAVPFILDKLAREDSRYGSQRKYRELWSKIPAAFRGILPRPKAGAFDELHACSILLGVGPGIIPMLCSALKDKNPAVREVSTHVLGCFQQQGKDISKATPALVEALRDPVLEVRKGAAWALDKDSCKTQQHHKSEIRSPKAERRPKSEARIEETVFRISSFGLLSDFGLRISGFDRGMLLQPALDEQATVRR